MGPMYGFGVLSQREEREEMGRCKDVLELQRYVYGSGEVRLWW